MILISEALNIKGLLVYVISAKVYGELTGETTEVSGSKSLVLSVTINEYPYELYSPQADLRLVH